jgi:Tannase and feruloyl esterase
MLLSFAGVAAEEPAAPALVEMLQLPDRAEQLPQLACEALVTRDFSRVPEGPARVQSAKIEAASGARAEFCLVSGYVAPTIRFELRLPTHSYTGRYLQGGCGGNCGVIVGRMMPACEEALAFGGAFAVGFEDSGHVGGDGVWALGGEQVRIDFAYRAAHAFAQAAKAIIAAYYGTGPAYAYFEGCSDGGREGMSETQRYPRDFNGVIAGSPALEITEAMERFIWETHFGHDAQGAAVFNPQSLQTLHEAVLESCDALDGLKDGQIDDPRRCHFDPGSLLCAVGASVGCLGEAQVAAARRFYAGPSDAAGVMLYPGGEPYGSELTWSGRGAVSEAGRPMLSEMVGLMAYQGQLPEGTTVDTWKFDLPTFRELQRRGAIYDTASPNLDAFRAAGGRLMLWYGAADPAAGVYGVPDYYQQLQERYHGLAATQDFVRLFVVPGVYHCFGGYVPYQEDYLGALVRWVELKETPRSLMASARLADGTVRRRPVYAYPAQARYIGSGDINDPENFRAELPRDVGSDAYPWAGAPRHAEH